ncbi:MAG: porin family protein [[Clostridium] fimetarium]|nr:porin family protein [Alistipes timonensis]MCM1405734.1 porin family protein [[Clostridium] fimetarium]
MKAVKILMMAGALAIATPAFAQFSNASAGARSTGGSSMVKDTNPYDRLSISYQNEKYSIDRKNADDYSTNGIAIDYLHGFSVSKTLPIFIETGIGANFGFYNDSETFDEGSTYEYEHKISTKTINLAIPVNVAYKFGINNDFAITPYLGLNFKLNVFSETTNKREYADEDVQEDYGSTHTNNNFDKKDVGKDYTWNRFQLGWHIGVGIDYKALYVGLTYGTDFMEIAKKVNTSTFKIGVGFNF